MANKVTDLFKKSSLYDKKHIKNLSTKKVPAALLQAVEKGCRDSGETGKGLPYLQISDTNHRPRNL